LSVITPFVLFSPIAPFVLFAPMFLKIAIKGRFCPLREPLI